MEDGIKSAGVRWPCCRRGWKARQWEAGRRLRGGQWEAAYGDPMTDGRTRTGARTDGTKMNRATEMYTMDVFKKAGSFEFGRPKEKSIPKSVRFFSRGTVYED